MFLNEKALASLKAIVHTVEMLLVTMDLKLRQLIDKLEQQVERQLDAELGQQVERQLVVEEPEQKEEVGKTVEELEQKEEAEKIVGEQKRKRSDVVNIVSMILINVYMTNIVNLTINEDIFYVIFFKGTISLKRKIVKRTFF